jgi:ribosome-interacting GTPase 1
MVLQSTLLSKVTHTTSETAAYEFTTLTVSYTSNISRQLTVMDLLGYSWCD